MQNSKLNTTKNFVHWTFSGENLNLIKFAQNICLCCSSLKHDFFCKISIPNRPGSSVSQEIQKTFFSGKNLNKFKHSQVGVSVFMKERYHIQVLSPRVTILNDIKHRRVWTLVLKLKIINHAATSILQSTDSSTALILLMNQKCFKNNFEDSYIELIFLGP